MGPWALPLVAFRDARRDSCAHSPIVSYSREDRARVALETVR